MVTSLKLIIDEMDFIHHQIFDESSTPVPSELYRIIRRYKLLRKKRKEFEE